MRNSYVIVKLKYAVVVRAASCCSVSSFFTGICTQSILIDQCTITNKLRLSEIYDSNCSAKVAVFLLFKKEESQLLKKWCSLKNMRKAFYIFLVCKAKYKRIYQWKI